MIINEASFMFTNIITVLTVFFYSHSSTTRDGTSFFAEAQAELFTLKARAVLNLLCRAFDLRFEQLYQA